MRRAQFVMTLIATIFLASCTTDPPRHEANVKFNNGICFVTNPTIDAKVRPTVMVVENPGEASRYLKLPKDSVTFDDAFVMHPDNPPLVPKFPIFMVSSTGEIVHVGGDAGAIPEEIAEESIPMAAAARAACDTVAAKQK